MSGDNALKISLRRMIVISAMLTLALCWTSVAEAQQGGPPADEQYGNPASSIGPSQSAQEQSAQEQSGGVSATASAAGGSEDQAGESGSASQVVSVLPDTGGPLLLLALGGGAMLGTGMLLARQIRRR
jgi:hypothetical protein